MRQLDLSRMPEYTSPQPEPDSECTLTPEKQAEEFSLMCEGSALHACPFQMEIHGNNDPEYCRCCHKCTASCHDHI